MIARSIPKQTTGYFIEDLDGEALLFRPGTQRAMHLNETAALIWRLCDGTRSVEDITALLAAEYPDAGTMDTDIAAAIDILQIEGALLELQRAEGQMSDAQI
jgi:hypothetical protein